MQEIHAAVGNLLRIAFVLSILVVEMDLNLVHLSCFC